MKKKGALLVSVSMVLVAVLALTTASFAWFTAGMNSSLSNVDLTVTTANALLISDKVDGEFGTSLDADKLLAIDSNIMGTFPDPDQADAVKTRYLTPSTPKLPDAGNLATNGLLPDNGVLKFQNATTFGTNGSATGENWVYADVTAPEKETETVGYMKFDLFFKSSVKADAGKTVKLNLQLTQSDGAAAYDGTTVKAKKLDGTYAAEGTPATGEGTDPEYYITYSLRYGFTYCKVLNVDGSAVADAAPTEKAAVYEPNSSAAPHSYSDAVVDGNTARAYTTTKSSSNGAASSDMEIIDAVEFGAVYKVTVYVWIEGNDVNNVNLVASSAFETALRFNGTIV